MCFIEGLEVVLSRDNGDVLVGARGAFQKENTFSFITFVPRCVQFNLGGLLLKASNDLSNILSRMQF